MKISAFDLVFQRIIPEMDHSPAGTVYSKPKMVKPSEYLLWYGIGARVSSDIYLPQQPSGVLEIDGRRFVNSYLPNLVPLAAEAWEGHWAVEVWQRHLETILPNDWPLLLTWLAYNAQHPGKKILWAPIVKGVPGDGKTSISKMLASVMGACNVKVISTESMFSDFNSFAEGACVGFLEEMRAKGHSRYDVMGKLKPLLTNEIIEIVRKGQDGRNVPNTMNYMGFSNHEDALVLDEGDRRWAVFFTRFRSRSELPGAGLTREHFDALHGAIERHPDILRAWLLAADTSDFDPHAAPPTTAAKRVMIANSLTADAVAIAELIALGRPGVGKHAVATDCLNAALKADGMLALVTSRLPAAFQQLGWKPLPAPIKWDGVTRRVYVDDAVAWPEDEARLRTAVRDVLDATTRRAIVTDEEFPEKSRDW